MILMAIKLEKVGTSALVGVADIVTEELDLYQGYTKAFQNVTDWARVVYAAGGYVANSMGIEPDATEVVVLSSMPLLEKSVYKAVKQYTGLGVAGRGRMGLKLIKKGRETSTPERRERQTGGTRIVYV